MVPFPFVSVDSAQVSLHNTLAGKLKRVPLQFKNTTYYFETISRPIEYKPEVTFTLRVGQEMVAIGLTPTPPAEVLGGSLKEVCLHDCPLALKAALLECWFEEILQTLEASFQKPYKIESLDVNPSTPEHSSHLVFFSIYTGNQPVPSFKGHLSLNERLLPGFLKFLDMLPPTITAPHLLANLPFKGSIEVGETVLTANECLSLRLNDVILLDRFFLKEEQQLQLVFEPNLCFNLRYNQSQATIASMNFKPRPQTAFYSKLTFLQPTKATDIDDEQEEEDEDDETSTAGGGPETLAETAPTAPAASAPNPAASTATPAPSAPINRAPAAAANSSTPAPQSPKAATPQQPQPSLGQLTVHLTFRVGEKYLSLSEIQNLKAGYTFELESTIEKPVTICANGTAVGMGELVQIDKRVGVRITDWGKALL